MCELGTAQSAFVRIARQIETKFGIAQSVSLAYLGSEIHQQNLRLGWKEQMRSTGTWTHFAGKITRIVQSVPRLVEDKPKVEVLIVGAGLNEDCESEEQVMVESPFKRGEFIPMIVTEPWQLAFEMNRAGRDCSIDVLDVYPAVVDCIGKTKDSPPKGGSIPEGLYQRAISEKIHPVLGNVLDIAVYEKLKEEYDLILSLGTLDSLACPYCASSGSKEDLAVTAFLILISRLKRDGWFVTTSKSIRDFAMVQGFMRLRWGTCEVDGMPLLI